MNWVCESCGYENEYNDESQPTECLCCGAPASDHLLNQARRALEKHHKEQERQRRLEQLRREAAKRQEKIERSINTLIKSMRIWTTACVVFMVLSVILAGFYIYKGNVSLKYMRDNVRCITVMDNIMGSVNMISDNLNQNGAEFENHIIQNISYIARGKNHALPENLKGLADENKKRMAITFSALKGTGGYFSERHDNRKDNITVSRSNVSEGFKHFPVNLKMFWKQMTKNVNQLIDSISKKIGRSK